MSLEDPLCKIPGYDPQRQHRDRLEILSVLMSAPNFSSLFRSDIIDVPADYPGLPWRCAIPGCERTRSSALEFCPAHSKLWRMQRNSGSTKPHFIDTAEPYLKSTRRDDARCRICPGRPAFELDSMLCSEHYNRWFEASRVDRSLNLHAWAMQEIELPSFALCRVEVCTSVGYPSLKLCSRHRSHYFRDGHPGAVKTSQHVDIVKITDQALIEKWSLTAAPHSAPGQLNLRGLRPLIKAEIQWCLFTHTQQSNQPAWHVAWLRALLDTCRDERLDSLLAFQPGSGAAHQFTSKIVKIMVDDLDMIYYTPEETKALGYIRTAHYGVSLSRRSGYFDLTRISQIWLRDMVWTYISDILKSAKCPRTGLIFDNLRRAAGEFSAFLDIKAEDGGRDPRLLSHKDVEKFVEDQNKRVEEGRASLSILRVGGEPSVVTSAARASVLNSLRRLFRAAMDDGTAEIIGISREFIVAIPGGGAPVGGRPREPFSDDTAKALADLGNLSDLAEKFDPHDRGLRDVWETTVATGRRIGEVLSVRLNCLGVYSGLPVFWHDQTKVGNYGVGIRIPDTVYEKLLMRQKKTVDLFFVENGRLPTVLERNNLALFPSSQMNKSGTKSLTHTWFHRGFKLWVDSLDLGAAVPHQARHTLATNLMRSGASLSQIRRYLGHVSDRMAEHYVHLTNADLETALQHVWVAGPGSPNPGALLSGSEVETDPAKVRMLAIDLTRRSTPSEGGFCTFQPVVQGGSCPWSLDCHNCDKFVLSGADLLYWRRKREQWRHMAEASPDDATAAYLHDYFEPTAKAIKGLESALASLGLLDQALALDMRKPQDYFDRIWSTGFLAHDLNGLLDGESDNNE